MQTRAPGGEVIGIEGVSFFDRSKNAEVHALDNISLTATDREFVAVLGPSGCGKSTLLKLIAGLIPPSSGIIRVNGRPITGPTASIGIVFQSPLLMAWRTVLQNVLLQIEIRNLSVAAYRTAARDLIGSWGSRDSRTPIRISYRVECNNASGCAAPSFTTRTSSSWTSRSARSTP